jgi:hypothetical protein
MLRNVTLGLPTPQESHFVFYRFLSLVPPGRISIPQQVYQSWNCDCVTIDGIDHLVRIIANQDDELDIKKLKSGEFLKVFTNVHHLFEVLNCSKPNLYQRTVQGTTFDIAICDVWNSDDLVLDFVHRVMRTNKAKIILIAPSLNSCRHVIFRTLTKLEYRVARGGTTGVCPVHGKRKGVSCERLFTNIRVNRIPSPQEAWYFVTILFILCIYLFSFRVISHFILCTRSA